MTDTRNTRQVHTFCRVCEPSCALIAEVGNDEMIRLKPDRGHPVTRGFACHKGLATLDIHKDPDRLNHPMARNPEGELVRISWDEAAGRVADAISSLTERYGDTALASYTGNPLAFNTTSGPAISSFLVKNRIRKNFSSGTQDCTNKFAGSEAVFGSSTIHPIPDIENTDFLLIFGSNPRISHMSFLSIADPMAALRRARKRGTRIRFVDPRRNESIHGIGELIQVHPDTDVYLMAAMLHHLHDTGRFDNEYLDAHADHVDGLIDFLSSYPAETVANVVGVSAGTIRNLADEFASAGSAAIYMSTGVNMGRQGTLAYWLLHMLSMVTGNLDKKGGNIYAEGFYPAARAGKKTRAPGLESTPFGELRKVRGALPGNLLADMILTDEDPIRGLIVISGNPLISMGGSQRLREAFRKLEFLLVIDIYPNATAELADVVLPATDMFERPDINLAGLGLQAQPFVQVTDAVVTPRAERKPEWWILARIEQAQGFHNGDACEEPDLFGRLDHMLGHSGLSIEKVRHMSHQTAVLPVPEAGEFYTKWIQTETGRVDCCPAIFTEAMDRCAGIFSELAAEAPGRLKMISRRTNYMLNSWFHNLDALKRRGHLSNPVYLHPHDARARNLGEGSEVTVSSESGEVRTTVALDDSLKPGTVAITHGWGHGGTGMQTARKYAGMNVNELLPSGPGSYEKLSNQSFMTGIPVEVSPYQRSP